ncbi:hypothetical protein OC846_006292 [Tilletia horrida]|uniref:AB hydrolase-1 domain-containing protein n=1 Tax=Tilletia horrida TaxID=155126 RepID=A0AAN6GJQ5_9BASI|nr:hypothetical protein OC846_006292 [Tilletia horrida]
MTMSPKYALTPERREKIANAFPASFESCIFDVPPPAEDRELRMQLHYLYHRAPPARNPNREAIVFLHGHPQNGLIWHRVARRLLTSAADSDRKASSSSPSTEHPGNWDLIVPDLRGRGASSAPTGGCGVFDVPDAQQARYTKRAMAYDVVQLVHHLGYAKRVWIVAHDRGARVAARLLADANENDIHVERTILLDIAPTLDMYSKTDSMFAKMYWHWFFLLQPQPYAEDMIRNSPDSYIDLTIARFADEDDKDDAERVFPSWALASYANGLDTYERAHALVEDYRASAPAGPDLDVDEEDRDAIAAGTRKRITTPVRLLWGARGLIEAAYDGGLDLWRQTMESIDGRSVDCGHYIPEEQPSEVVNEIVGFFGPAAHAAATGRKGAL